MSNKNSSLSERVNTLSAEKRRLLEIRLNKKCQPISNPLYIASSSQTECKPPLANIYDEDGRNKIDAGFGSFAIMELFSYCRKRINRLLLNTQRFFRIKTTKEVNRFFKRLMINEAFNSALVPLRPSNRGNGVFIIPGGLGEKKEILVFVAFLRLMKNTRPFYALRSGVYDYKWRPKTLAEHAKRIVNELGEKKLTRNITLIGECTGSSVVLAVNQEMSRCQYPVESIILLDPGTLDYLQAIKERKLKDRLVKSERLGTSTGFQTLLRQVKFSKRRRFDSIAHYHTLLSQVPNEPITTPVHIILSTRYPDLEKITDSWQRVATGPLKIYKVPGDHRTFVRDDASHAVKIIEGILDT